jgi:WS/DGAT/MGAT family acyltransferase
MGNLSAKHESADLWNRSVFLREGGGEMARTSVSCVDKAWLRMEDPTNLMMITGVMVFGTPMQYERLKAIMQHRLLRFDRFWQRVVRPLFGAYYWEEDPDFDLDYHLRRASLPPPGDQAALQDLTSLLASTQLDFSKPLWQVHLVENYGEGSALICRLHHCIGDGLALVYVLLSLTDTGPDDPFRPHQPQLAKRPQQDLSRRLPKPADKALKTARRATDSLVHQYQQVRDDPSHAKDLARTSGRATYDLAKLLLLWPDPGTIYKGPLNVPKRTAWSWALSLQEVKAVGKALGGTVNDVLLTAMSGALRRYLQGRGENVDGLNFRAVVPVNLRRPGTEEELGNKFGLVFLSLPIGIADPTERLRELTRRMDGLKDSLQAPVAFGILTAIGMSPQPVEDLVVTMFGMKGTAVMTNVMGPRIPLYLAGAPLESLMFWVPQSGHLGLGVSILSYAGQVWMGVISDRGLVPDPEMIINEFYAEFNGLISVAGLAAQPAAPIDASAQAAVLSPEEAGGMLEVVVEEEAAEPEATPSTAPEHCQALTKAGTPCQNRPLPGSSYCRIHQR